MIYFLVAVAAYLVGAIPTSVIISKFFLKDDIRSHGSGNPGTSNMIRTFGISHGVITFLGDAVKGVLGTLIGLWIGGTNAMLVAAIAVVIGHNWSIFIHFRGGKGAATSFGAMLAILPLWSAISLSIFVGVSLITRYFSLGSICATLFVWIAAIIGHWNDPYLIICCTILLLMLLVRHKENIKRLINGTENKISIKKK